MYYRGAAAAIVVYDITRASSFKTLKHWVEELMSKGPKDIAIAIAGNKADMEEQREVDRAMASSYADEIGAMYLETSAKEDMNVQDVFVKLSYRLPAAPQGTDTNIIKATNAAAMRNANTNSNSGGCC